MSTTANILVIGASGRTGGSIMDALINSGKHNISITTRPGSENKPIVEEYRSRGVNVYVVAVPSPRDGSLEKAMQGKDIVVSAIHASQIESQKEMIDAAKEAGVKRFIPCDFGTACVRGERVMYDKKQEIHDYIIQRDLGYTFIDVGWWSQITLPFTSASQTPETIQFPWLVELSREFFGEGKTKTAITDRRDIGLFVERIITDPRTLNRYVFCWTEEVTQSEIFGLADKFSGTEIPRHKISPEELRSSVKEKKDSNDIFSLYRLEYQYSLWVKGDNTIENAKKPEYGSALDTRELYPDLAPKLRRLESFAKELYKAN